MHLADLAIKCGCHSVCTALGNLQSPWWDVSLNSLLACLILTFFHMKHLHASKLNPKIQGEDSHSFNYLPNPVCLSTFFFCDRITVFRTCRKHLKQKTVIQYLEAWKLYFLLSFKLFLTIADFPQLLLKMPVSS